MPSKRDVLAHLTRAELKEVCGGLGLDDAGKEKSVPVDRLPGAPGKTAPPAPKANGAPRPAPSPADKVDISPSVHFTSDRLEGNWQGRRGLR